jgi:hypothetical protein
MSEPDWRDRLIGDLRKIGVVADVCLGCGKVDCDSCPCGSGISIIHDKLAPEAAQRLKEMQGENEKPKEPPDPFIVIVEMKDGRTYVWGESSGKPMRFSSKYKAEMTFSRSMDSQGPIRKWRVMEI